MTAQRSDVGPRPLPIVAFSKDWDDDPTSNHHVLRVLAQTRRVLWLNSVGTRTPDLSSGRDLGRVLRKLREFARGPRNVENDLWVFTPLVLPLPDSSLARRVNRVILRVTVDALRARLRIRNFQTWTFLPNVADYIVALGDHFSVYYCVDEWSMFGQMDAERTRVSEEALLQLVDCVFAVNESLAAAKRPINPETHVAPHGVDKERFARALAPGTSIPEDLAAVARPVLGFYGALEEWVDVPLLAAVANRHPDWSLVILGSGTVDMSRLEGLRNVHILGRRPYEELPAYCKGFDVALIPYLASSQLPFRNPIKLREYLAAGLSIVSTLVPEVSRYQRWCRTAGDSDAFIDAIEIALAEDSPELRAERSEAMESETWSARVAEVAGVADALAARRSRGDLR